MAEKSHIQRLYLPPPDSFWRHRNGNKYRVVLLANLHSNRDEYPVMVVYAGPEGRIWSRRLDDWHRSMTLIDEEASFG